MSEQPNLNIFQTSRENVNFLRTPAISSFSFLGAADSRHFQLIASLDQTQSAYRKEKSYSNQKYQFDIDWLITNIKVN